jgi:hypothetical protein
VSGEGHRQQFERMGIDEVRARLISGKLPLQMIPDAVAWTAQFDREERERNSSAQAAQSAAAARQSAAAERQAAASERLAREAEATNKRDVVARMIAIAGIIISIVCSAVTAGIVHWDATHPTTARPAKP